MVSVSAVAQTSVNSHLFRFSDTLETVQLEDALGVDSEMFKHRVMLRVSYDFVDEALIRITADRDTQTGTVVDSIHSISLGGGVMVSDRVYIGLTLPFHYTSLDPNATVTTATDLDDWELGDIHLKLKWRLTKDDSQVNFAIMPWGFLPTGRNNQANNYLISDDSYGFGASLLADTTFFGRLSLYVNGGFSYANNAEFVSIDRRARIDTGLGAYFRITDFLGVNGELINSFTVSSLDKDQNPVQFNVGLRGKVSIVRLFVGMGVEGLRDSRSSDFTWYAGAKVPFGSREPEPIKPVIIVEPEPEPEPVIMQKIKVLKENLSVQREINFETDKSVILEESYGELNSAAEIIMEYGQYISSITIEGHTDSRGSAAYNQALSERRAQSVRRYLINQGVPASKLNAVGYGESRPKVEEVGPETLLMNRRVEFKVNEEIEVKKEIDVIEYPDGTVEEVLQEESVIVE